MTYFSISCSHAALTVGLLLLKEPGNSIALACPAVKAVEQLMNKRFTGGQVGDKADHRGAHDAADQEEDGAGASGGA